MTAPVSSASPPPISPAGWHCSRYLQGRRKAERKGVEGGNATTACAFNFKRGTP